MSAKRRAALLDLLAASANGAGRYEGDLRDIRTRLGVSRHDIMKSLYELRALGRVSFRDPDPGPDTVIAITLRHARRRATPDRTADLLDWIAAHGGADGEWVPVAPLGLGGALGMSYQGLLSLLRRLQSKGTIAVRYRGGGPRTGIDALRVVWWTPLVEAPPEEPAPPALPPTPLLDGYRAVRAFAAEHPENPWIGFVPNPVAEEAVAYLDALANAEDHDGS